MFVIAARIFAVASKMFVKLLPTLKWLAAVIMDIVVVLLEAIKGALILVEGIVDFFHAAVMGAVVAWNDLKKVFTDLQAWLDKPSDSVWLSGLKFLVLAVYKPLQALYNLFRQLMDLVFGSQEGRDWWTILLGPKIAGGLKKKFGWGEKKVKETIIEEDPESVKERLNKVKPTKPVSGTDVIKDSRGNTVAVTTTNDQTNTFEINIVANDMNREEIAAALVKRLNREKADAMDTFVRKGAVGA
jgi:hypothetical protein